jgi:hypothetical protein
LGGVPFKLKKVQNLFLCLNPIHPCMATEAVGPTHIIGHASQLQAGPVHLCSVLWWLLQYGTALTQIQGGTRICTWNFCHCPALVHSEVLDKS